MADDKMQTALLGEPAELASIKTLKTADLGAFGMAVNTNLQSKN
jgi:hypothetical protein